MANGEQLAIPRPGVVAWKPRRRRHRRRWSTRVAVVLRGLLAGALAAVTFQQGAVFLLSLARLAPPPSLGFKPDPSQVVPDIVSAALWGAIWGAVLAPLLPRGRPPGRTYWITAALLGAILPTLAAWVVTVGPAGVLRYGQDWFSLATAGVAYGAWGLGTALLLLVI